MAVMDDTTDVWAKLGAQLKKARGSRTQGEVAEKLNAAMGTNHHPTVITKIENGKRPLNFVEAIHLARILHIDPEAMMETIGARDETAQWDEIHGTVFGMNQDLMQMTLDIEKLGKKMGQLLQAPPPPTASEWVTKCRENGEDNLQKLRNAYAYIEGAGGQLGSISADTDRRAWEFDPDDQTEYDYPEIPDDGSA